MSEEKKTPQDELNLLLDAYLENILKELHPELEVRFGTKGIKPISRIDYENVIQKLLSLDFQIYEAEQNTLRIQNEFIDKRSGKTRISNVRTEIEGLKNIQNYCKTNSISEDSAFIQFIQKQYFRKNNTIIYPVNYDDWNFRISFQTEKTIPLNSPVIQTIIEKWERTKKNL